MFLIKEFIWVVKKFRVLSKIILGSMMVFRAPFYFGPQNTMKFNLACKYSCSRHH